jgi:hypothetical protein
MRGLLMLSLPWVPFSGSSNGVTLLATTVIAPHHPIAGWLELLSAKVDESTRIRGTG